MRVGAQIHPDSHCNRAIVIMMRASLLSLVLVGLLLPFRPAEAQAPFTVGVGYAANAPRQMAGATVHFIIPGLRGFGLYLDGKFDPGSDTRSGVLLQGVTHQDAETVFRDEWFRDDSRWTTFNAGLLYSVTPELRIYAGAGRVQRDAYTEYWDESMERGDRGFYWIEDPANSGAYVNFLGGAFLRMAPGLFAQMGLESRPRGFTVGGALSFPRY
jgi:hypothetical protein